MSSSGPPGSPPANQDRVPAPTPYGVPADPDPDPDPDPEVSDPLLPDSVLAPIGMSVPIEDDIYDESMLRPSSFGQSVFRRDSPELVPLDTVPSFRTIDPLRPPPPSFEEVPPTPPGYQAQAPQPPPLPAPGGTRRFRFTLPTWEDIRASFERVRLWGSGGGSSDEGDADPGTRKRKRDRAKKTAKACWRKLGLGKKEEEDRDGGDGGGSQAPEQASPVVAPTVVFIKK